MDKMKIAERLKELRHKKGVSVTEVATACGITPQALSQYESGDRVPRDEVKIKLADYYKKSVATLFYA